MPRHCSAAIGQATTLTAAHFLSPLRSTMRLLGWPSSSNFATPGRHLSPTTRLHRSTTTANDANNSIWTEMDCSAPFGRNGKRRDWKGEGERECEKGSSALRLSPKQEGKKRGGRTRREGREREPRETYALFINAHKTQVTLCARCMPLVGSIEKRRQVGGNSRALCLSFASVPRREAKRAPERLWSPTPADRRRESRP